MIVFLQSLRAASNGSYAFGSLWKTLRDERTVAAWIYDPSERWRSVSFEFQLHQGLDPRDLTLVVSTFVPFGVPSGVTVNIGDGQLEVKGPKGVLTTPIPAGVSFKQEDGTLTAERAGGEQAAFHGLARALAT